MKLNAANQLGEIPDLRRHNDPRMGQAPSLPPTVQPLKVADVERQDCPSVPSGIVQLLLIRDALIGSTGPLTAFNIVPESSERASQARVHHLVGEQREAETAHQRERIARSA